MIGSGCSEHLRAAAGRVLRHWRWRSAFRTGASLCRSCQSYVKRSNLGRDGLGVAIGECLSQCNHFDRQAAKVIARYVGIDPAWMCRERAP